MHDVRVAPQGDAAISGYARWSVRLAEPPEGSIPDRWRTWLLSASMARRGRSSSGRFHPVLSVRHLGAAGLCHLTHSCRPVATSFRGGWPSRVVRALAIPRLPRKPMPGRSTANTPVPAALSPPLGEGSPRRCSQPHRHQDAGVPDWSVGGYSAASTGATTWTPILCSSSFSSCCSSAAVASSIAGVAYELLPAPEPARS
jgi:hypothetical protein